ncbi:PREDICTED: uncharacterized protein LOC103591397 [Galeopterus variegatus]|uniref:Ubiquitin carboxyl-terminal hydrolase 46 n=1 Tax=Galeopterus variegatus TaxID=482537 RepID=A0ABM0QUL6_GALVR|nr:PREDICTED: uncharacterized protein LOC103591397 [Galeopterus variegatus]
MTVRNIASICNMGTNASALEKDIGPEQFPINEHYFGLVNFGNTCYCNSVLQALYFCRPFRENVLAYKAQQKKKENLLTCLADLFHSIATQKKKVGVIPPKKFISRLRKENVGGIKRMLKFWEPWGKLKIVIVERRMNLLEECWNGTNASALEKDIGPEQFPINEHYFGLVNFGNTCYCNSVLQALYFCRPFRENVLAYKAQQKKKENLLTCLADLFHSIATQKKKVGVIPPKKFISRLRKENAASRLVQGLI